MWLIKGIIYFLLISLYLPTAIAAERVIHISVDGLYSGAIDILGDARLPNFARLRSEGAATLSARTDTDFTSTLPNHASQFTGRRVDAGCGGHDWVVNRDPGSPITLHTNAGKYIAGIFDQVHDAGKSTVLFAGKEKFGLFDRSWDNANGSADTNGVDNGKDKIDRYVYNNNTAILVSDFISDLQATIRHYAFLHIRDPDSAGHASSWDWDIGSDYLNSIIGVDGYLGAIISFVETDTEYKDKTTIILTSDHGGEKNASSHNHDALESHVVPFIVWGSDVSPGRSLYDLNVCTAVKPIDTGNSLYSASLNPIRNADAANLAAKLLNLEDVPGSQVKTVLQLKPSSENDACIQMR